MTVFLVGAGPGDPGLLTVRGAEVLGRADVVVYDRLSAPGLLDLAPAGAERISVGKGPQGPSTPQDEINRVLVERGRSGATVVRLKGGDPFVFARGGEELAVLLDAGVDVEVVPGVTSAVAVPAYAGIPVTLRYASTSFTVVTGHEDPTKGDEGVDWEAIARVGGTVVVLMGVAHVAEICARLVAGGLDPRTPAAAVRWGTRPDQDTVRATLATLADQELRAPSVIVVGEVAGTDLAWFERRPLFGRSVLVTRPAGRSSGLARRLGDRGARVVELPTIAEAPPSDGGVALAAAVAGWATARPDWVVVTSPTAAARVLDAVGDVRRLAGIGLAAIGPGTAAELGSRGLVPDLVPGRYVAEGLLEVFPDPPAGGGRVVVARAEVAREVLVDELAARGWRVDEVATHRTVPVPVPEHRRAEVADLDAVAFASSSAVRAFLDAVPPGDRPAVAVTIGPLTAATAREGGFPTVVEAEVHSLDGLVDAFVAWARTT